MATEESTMRALTQIGNLEARLSKIATIAFGGILCVIGVIAILKENALDDKVDSVDMGRDSDVSAGVGGVSTGVMVFGVFAIAVGSLMIYNQNMVSDFIEGNPTVGAIVGALVILNILRQML